jgi:hypothetical protein
MALALPATGFGWVGLLLHCRLPALHTCRQEGVSSIAQGLRHIAAPLHALYAHALHKAAPEQYTYLLEVDHSIMIVLHRVLERCWAKGLGPLARFYPRTRDSSAYNRQIPTHLLHAAAAS